MSSLLFLIRRTLWNIIKSAFRKPIVLIGYIVVALLLGGTIVASFVMPSGMLRQSSPEFFRGIMVLIFVFLYYTTLKLGIDKGSTYFRAADVNMIFTAPISPNKVLLYGFIKQLGGTFLLLFIALFQIPNLKNNFVMKPYGVPMLMLAVAAYALAYPLISMVIYSWTSKAKQRKKLAKRVFDIGALAVGLIFLFDLSQTRDFVATLSNIFDSPAAQYFPIFGWTASIASSAVSGFTLPFIVGASGMLVLIIGASIALYKMNLDYYEDVLEATEYIEAARQAKKEGRNMTFNLKVKENVKQKMTGSGARAIFAKNILEQRKTSMFLFLDRLSITVIIASLAFNFIMPDEMKNSSNGLESLSMLLVLCFAVYMLMLMQVQGRWSTELDKHYIFLVPASPLEKLFYSTLSEHVKNLFDGSLLFIVAGVLFKGSIPTVVACILSYVAFGAVFTYTDVLARRLFGGVHGKGLLIFLKMISSILIQVPGIVLAVVVGMLLKSGLMVIITLGGWSLVLAITFFMFSAGTFKNLETTS